MKIRFMATIALVASIGFSSTVFSATLELNAASDTVAGIKGIIFDGAEYNASFNAGSINDIGIQRIDSGLAYGLSQSLSNFIKLEYADTSSLTFTWFSNQLATEGCSFSNNCLLNTVTDNSSYTGNAYGGWAVLPPFYSFGIDRTALLGDGNYLKYSQVIWERAPLATPIPAAAFMFAPALLGFLGFRRKAKNILA